MSTLETDLALLLTIPEERQGEQTYLLTNFCAGKSYKPLSGIGILAELAE